MDIEMRVEGGTRYFSQSDEISIGLRVADGASGEVLVDVVLSTDDWVRLTSGTSLRVMGHTSPHLDRVGRKMVHRTVSIPSEEITTYKREEAEVQARLWAENPVLRQPGETVEVRSTNQGWMAIYRSWPEVTE